MNDIEKLRAVAVAARELAQSAYDVNWHTTAVDDCLLTALETALAEAGYDMTDEEIEAALDREPSEPDGECFRGGEAAAFLADEQARIQRELK